MEKIKKLICYFLFLALLMIRMFGKAYGGDGNVDDKYVPVFYGTH